MIGSFRNHLVATLPLVQSLALALIVALAIASTAWSLAALAGWVPWLQLKVNLGSTTGVEAGIAIQAVMTLLLLGLCFFVPANARVMALERSHRDFKVSMHDVARAYQVAHAADREGAFGLQSEFDSVRDRLIHLRRHADLGALEPELLEIAAQMSHVSRELAEVYSDDKIERARTFLRQRQEEARAFQERVELARATCSELKRWLEAVHVEEAVARAQVVRLQADLEEILPEVGFAVIQKPTSKVTTFEVAAE